MHIQAVLVRAIVIDDHQCIIALGETFVLGQGKCRRASLFLLPCLLPVFTAEKRNLFCVSVNGATFKH